MNILYENRIKDILSKYKNNEIQQSQAVWSILNMPEVPEMIGLWQMLIIHIYLIEFSIKVEPEENSVYRNYWHIEIKAWQDRISGFYKKKRISFRNAVKKKFYDACNNLFSDEFFNLILNIELHRDEMILMDEDKILEIIEQLEIHEKPLDWFLNYTI